MALVQGMRRRDGEAPGKPRPPRDAQWGRAPEEHGRLPEGRTSGPLDAAFLPGFLTLRPPCLF